MLEIEDLLEQAEKESNEKFKVFIVHPEEEFKGETNSQEFIYPKCYVPFFWTTVGSDGCLYPCGHRGGEFGWNLGSLLENNLLDLLSKLKDNPRVCNLPDSNCVVCPPYAARLNPMIDYILKNKDTRDVDKILIKTKESIK